MKITGLQENIKLGISAVSHIASKNINLPILNNIKIEALAGEIKLITTNLEIGITYKLRGKIENEGAYTAEAKILADYVGLLPNKKVNMEHKDGFLLINCDNYKTKIKGQSSEEYPLIPVIEKNFFYSANIEEFKQALSQVVFAAAIDDTRLELSGALFSFGEKDLTIAATDSYRLAEKKIKIKTNNKEAQKIIIPVKTLQEVLRILPAVGSENIKDEEKEVKMYLTENQIMFAAGAIELVSRIIEGQYPDYQQIIPQNSKTIVAVDRGEFIRAVKASAIFSKAGINDVNLDFPGNKNNIVISSVSGQTGESTTEISARVNGSDNGVVLNYRYLLDGLNNINAESVKIEIIDGNTPIILRSENEQNYLYIIMPIKQ